MDSNTEIKRKAETSEREDNVKRLKEDNTTEQQPDAKDTKPEGQPDTKQENGNMDTTAATDAVVAAKNDNDIG